MLVLLLWVLTILMMIVLSFSTNIRRETFATIGFRDNLDKKLLAQAGIERGIIELFYRNTSKNQEIAQLEKKYWDVDASPYSLEIFGGNVTISIAEESGKININSLNDLSGIILKNLLINMNVPEQEALTIVDSILDWKDSDDLRRLNGAESDYYLSLPIPYRAKNEKFDTIEELALVRGITEEILYGSDSKKGIYEFVTVYSNSDTINIRFAPREVLLAIPGFTEELVGEIIEKRKGLPESQTINIPIPQESQQFISQHGSSNIFTILSRAFKGNERSSFNIKATVILEGNKVKYLYYKSPVSIKE
ncbi:MAG: general secretion pathway protein GspK [Thermodesulfovibrionales bacterium]|nr:general secretion pathway protein GspK [Thermodesulfovibrionales bacterium]